MTSFTHHIILPPGAKKGDVYTWQNLMTGETRTSKLNRKFIRERELNAPDSKNTHWVTHTWVELIDICTGEVYERILMGDLDG